MKIQNGDFGPYELSRKSQIQFFIGLEYANFTYYYDESIFNVYAEETTVEYLEVNGTTVQTLKTREIRLRKCSEIYSNNDVDEKNLNIPLDLFVCVDPSEKAQIQGFWGSKVSKSLKVKLQKCQNSTLSNNLLSIANATNVPNKAKCRSKAEIDRTIQNGVLSVYTSDYLVNQKNFTSPTNKYFRDVYNYLSANDGLIYVIDYSDFLFKSDTGFLIPSYTNWNIPMVSDIKNSYSFGESQMFAFINFQGFKLAESYQRSYSKIQDILTKVGGLIKALTLIGFAINWIFSKPFFIINNIIDNHNYLKLKPDRRFCNLSPDKFDSAKNVIFISKPRKQVNPNINESFRNRSIERYNYFKKHLNKNANVEDPAPAAPIDLLQNNDFNNFIHNNNNCTDWNLNKNDNNNYNNTKNRKNNKISFKQNEYSTNILNSSNMVIHNKNLQTNIKKLNLDINSKITCDANNQIVIVTDENTKKENLQQDKESNKSKSRKLSRQNKSIKSINRKKEKTEIKSEKNIEKSVDLSNANLHSNKKDINNIKEINRSEFKKSKSPKKTNISSKAFLTDSAVQRNSKTFCGKLSMFKLYWCPKKNPKLNDIFNFKERLIDKVLSLETLNKVYFDVELLKVLNYNIKELRKMDNIHYNLFYDVDIYEKLRNYLYFNNNGTSCNDLSILGLFNEEDNSFLKRLEHFFVDE